MAVSESSEAYQGDHRVKWLALIAILLTACGSAPAPTMEQVAQAIGAVDVQAGKVGNTVPQSYTEHAKFVYEGKPGQAFICDTKKNCDAIYAYFDVLKGLAGPYTYQSDSGRVVIQLNSALTPAQGAAAAEAIKPL